MGLAREFRPLLIAGFILGQEENNPLISLIQTLLKAEYNLVWPDGVSLCIFFMPTLH